MKTHEVASILSTLAAVLRRSPNQDIEDFNSLPTRRSKPDPGGIPLALSTLVALSDFDKTQWIEFIRDNKYPIEVRPRDASRDLIGKILNHLAENPEARKKLSSTAKHARSGSSPELMRAFEALLRE